MEILLTGKVATVPENTSTNVAVQNNNTTVAADNKVNETVTEEVTTGDTNASNTSSQAGTGNSVEGDKVEGASAEGDTVTGDASAEEPVTDEAVTDEAVTGEGEMGVTGDSEGVVDTPVAGEDIVIDDPNFNPEMPADPGMEEGTIVDPGMTGIKDPLLSSWTFVIGISAVVLLVSIALGVFLAKRKIKKGIELYED